MTSASRLQAPYRAAHYLCSVHNLRDLPPDDGREVAFVGRSNSGKSSAINALTGQNALARTSKTPGRTQQLVYFRLDDNRRIVDLPGYGFAKVPEALRRHWRETIDAYFSTRRSLRGLVLLMDVRRPLSEFDRQMLDWCVHHGVPAHAVLTKADKLKRGPAQSALLKVRREVPPGVTAQLFSARKRDGVTELARHLAPWYGYAQETEPKAAADSDSRTRPGNGKIDAETPDDSPAGDSA